MKSWCWIVIFVFICSWPGSAQNQRKQKKEIQKRIAAHIKKQFQGKKLAWNTKKRYKDFLFPNELRKIDSWFCAKCEVPVQKINLQKTSAIRVMAYVCNQDLRYWLRVKGTILKLDLWYGPYSLPFYAKRNLKSFSSLFQSHDKDTPSLHPVGLFHEAGYMCKTHHKVTQKFSIPSWDFNYKIYAYYCDPGKHYWVQFINPSMGWEYWEGPFYLYPVPEASLVTRVILGKSQYREGEPIHIQVVIENNSNHGIWLNFSSGTQGNYQIDQRYQWTDNHSSIEMIVRKFIEPYSKEVLLDYYHTPKDYYLTPGQHSIVGIVSTTNYGDILSAPVYFSVFSYAPEPGPEPTIAELMEKAILNIQLKKYAKARKFLKKIVRKDPYNYLAYYNLACVESLTFHIEKALQYLEKALQLGFKDFEHIEKDSDLDNIRYYPRFEELIEQYQTSSTF